MRVDSLNYTISILLITLILFGVMPGMVFALDVTSDLNLQDYAENSSSENSSIGNLNVENSNAGEKGVNENYSLSTIISELDYDESESELLNYDEYELLDYNDSELLDYEDYELYNDDDWSDYDSSSSDLEVIRDFLWMGIYLCEPADNYRVKELAIKNIMGGYPVRFVFSENATCITYIEFDPLMTFRKTMATAGVLKYRSVFVQEPPAGRVYQYADIIVGDKGAGLPGVLKNGSVGFKVEKSWINDNNVNESRVTLQWYNNSWGPLYTEKVGEDNNYVYFKSKTPGFFFFAITEYSGEADTNYTEDVDEGYAELEEDYSEEDYTEEEEDYTEEEEDYTEEEEDYTRKADMNSTRKADTNCTPKSNVKSTHKAAINSTRKANVNGTRKANVNGTQKAGVNCTSKADVKSISKVNEKSTSKANVNCTSKADVKSISKVNVNSTRKADVNCTQKVDVKIQTKQKIFKRIDPNVTSNTSKNSINTNKNSTRQWIKEEHGYDKMQDYSLRVPKILNNKYIY